MRSYFVSEDRDHLSANIILNQIKYVDVKQLTEQNEKPVSSLSIQ